jgi:maltose O-acetyltransferase
MSSPTTILKRIIRLISNPRRAVLLAPYLVYKFLFNWHEEYRYETYREVYEVDATFRFGGIHILLYGAGRIVLGENSYIGNYSTIYADEGCTVSIGSGCAISHNVRIYTQTWDADQDLGREPKLKVANVTIEDNVWVGASVFINPGITIGKNSVVGANSMVTKDVPPDSIVGGVPARLIRMKADSEAGDQSKGSFTSGIDLPDSK